MTKTQKQTEALKSSTECVECGNEQDMLDVNDRCEACSRLDRFGADHLAELVGQDYVVDVLNRQFQYRLITAQRSR